MAIKIKLSEKELLQVASDIHDYYRYEGTGITGGYKWLRKEDDKPLKETGDVNIQKNKDAAKDVLKNLKSIKGKTKIQIMEKLVDDFLSKEKNKLLEKISKSQHEQWKKFVETYQKERITKGHPDFRKKTLDQFKTKYEDLSNGEKHQDRLVVAIVTDSVLVLKGIRDDYKIEFPHGKKHYL